MTGHGFASVILDVDSTLCGIEGIDWLAALRGGDVMRRVRETTDRAMAGTLPLQAVYSERLSLVKPTETDINALAMAYIGGLASGAADAIRRLHEAGRQIVLVSGGLREAILPVAAHVGIGRDDVYAVSVQLNADGSYRGYDATSPLATSEGKPIIARQLHLPPRVLAVGDGATDLAIRPAVDAFAAFTGFASRPAVVNAADLVISSFDQLVELVLA